MFDQRIYGGREFGQAIYLYFDDQIHGSNLPLLTNTINKRRSCLNQIEKDDHPNTDNRVCDSCGD